MGYHVIHDVAETAGARPHDLFLVEAEDLRHWAEHAAAEERRMLLRLIEDTMRYALLDGVDPAVAMAELLAGLEERSGMPDR